MSERLRWRWDGRARLWFRIWLALSCNWFTLGLECAVKGHDWRDSHVCIAMAYTSCSRCGRMRGTYRKNNGREKCSRLVVDSPGRGRVEFAKYSAREEKR